MRRCDISRFGRCGIYRPMRLRLVLFQEIARFFFFIYGIGVVVLSSFDAVLDGRVYVRQRGGVLVLAILMRKPDSILFSGNKDGFCNAARVVQLL